MTDIKNDSKPTQKNNPFSEKINAARNADLLQYFQKNGYEIEQKGSEYYIKEINGLCINPSKMSWYSHYDNIGGTNSIDCLTKILGEDFKTAVEKLSSGISSNISFQHMQNNQHVHQKKEKDLMIPEPAENNNRVIAYLVKTRKIPPEIVFELIKNNKLYQEKNTGNAVFPHTKNGKIVGAEVVGTNSDVRFKGVAAGTGSSVYSFAFSEKAAKAYIFESAIDLMSFYAMVDREKNNLEGIAFVSMAGLKPSAIKELEAQGIEILSCVDNDERGRKFETDNGFKRAGNMLEREGVKDWNELWQKNMEAEKSADSPEKKEADSPSDEMKNNPADLDNVEQDYDEIDVD
jgi:hypothetical protein